MKVLLKGSWRGLTSFSWPDIPEFAVLTGLNGAGKSNLLHGLRDAVGRNFDIQGRSLDENGIPQDQIAVLELAALREECLHLDPKSWELTIDLGSIYGIDQLHEQIRSLWEEFESHRIGMRRRSPRRAVGVVPKKPYSPIAVAIVERAGVGYDDVSYAQFEKHTSVYDLHQGEFNRCLFGHLFFAYRVRQLEAITLGQSAEEFQNLNGTPPWELVHRLVEEFDLPFHFTDPRDMSITQRFQLEMRANGSEAKLQMHDLSSGERILFSILVWVFYAQYLRKRPKLLLLDEMDAFLHPSMTKRVLRVFEDTLVKLRGVRVIMATHSPTTVAMVPEESIFVMARTGPRIAKVTKRDALASLTAGLVVVHAEIR